MGPPSPAAQDLICKLLVAEPRERLTATQCLRHPWLARRSPRRTRAVSPASKQGEFFSHSAHYSHIDICRTPFPYISPAFFKQGSQHSRHASGSSKMSSDLDGLARGSQSQDDALARHACRHRAPNPRRRSRPLFTCTLF